MEMGRALSASETARSATPSERLTAREWLVCAVAGIGFLFDTYEIVIQSIVVRPALLDFATFQPGSTEFNRWVGWLLYLPFLAGGLAGLVGGYLTDKLGRRRVLLWSIVLYAVATVGAAFATSPGELLFWRCATIVGVCTEWVAATAWITEMFSDRRREAALGFTQAFAGVGIFLVGGVYYLAVTYGHLLPEIRGSHAGWRYALMFGALPIFPTLLARLRLPESPRWQELKSRGGPLRPSFRELFRPAHRRVTLTASALIASIYGIAFGVAQHMPRIVPGLPEVRELPRLQQEQTISFVHFMQDVGGLIGRFALAFLVVSYLTKRQVLRSFQLPALVLFPLLFAMAPHLNIWLLACGALLASITLNGQINFIGNYLPQVYPAHLRGTGESFAISVGGRIIGTGTAMVTAWLANFTPGTAPAEKLAYAAATMALMAGLLGLFISRLLIEPGSTRANEQAE
jgi:MFS family permease